MKKFLLFFVLLTFAFVNTQAEEASPDTLTIGGIKVIKLNGSHPERGYTYGKLLADQIYDVYYNYFVSDALGPMVSLYANLLDEFRQKAVIESKYREEAYNVVRGLLDSDRADDFNAIWERTFHVDDLLLANTIVEMASDIGCSSLISWGKSTSTDPVLFGELIITRHLDWKYVPTLYNNQVIVAHDPTEPDEQRWVSIGVAGLIGALSGANETGVGVFQHMGNINHHDAQRQYEPILLTLRNAIEKKDITGDNVSRTEDVWEAINRQTQGGTFIVDVVNARKNLDSAFIVECSGDVKEVRTVGDHSGMPGTNLVATNHFRKLDAPIECERYDNVQALLLIDSILSISENWSYLKLGAGLPNNLQTIQYIPSKLQFNLSCSDTVLLGWEKEPFTFTFDDLFGVISVHDKNIANISSSTLSPNPASVKTQVQFTVDQPTNINLEFVSSTGRIVKSIDMGFVSEGEQSIMVQLDDLNNGVYFLKIRTDNSYITNKILVIK